MSTISPLGTRSTPASLYNANQLSDGKTTGLTASQTSKTASAATTSLSTDALDLQKRVASIGSSTIDFAQDFMSSITQALFGDAAKGATIAYDSASLDASSSLSVAALHSQGANGTTDAAGFQLTDSSHFIGKGTITTADGRKFDFEVEVQYDAQLTSTASQTTSASQPSDSTTLPQSADTSDGSDGSGSSDSSNTSGLPSLQLPNIDFAGTLADLFQLIGRNLQTVLSTGDGSGSQTDDGIDNSALRGLSLRLLSLVDSKNSDTYDAPASADKAKAAADAYGTQAASDAATTDAATPATDSGGTTASA